MNIIYNNRTLRLAAFALVLGGVSIIQGCAVVTSPISQEDIKTRASTDLVDLFKHQDPVTQDISLYEAIARALKYNLDHRVKLMDEALAQKRVDVARMSLLPQMSLDAGYKTRSNVASSTSKSLDTGTTSTSASTSQDKGSTVANGSVVWNVLDFGVSYAQARQEADLWRIAKEQRRKVVQNITEEVRTAFWKALSAQYLANEMDALLAEVDSSLTDSRQMQDKGLQTPLEALRFQQTLLATKRVLWGQRRSLALATTELSRLMNLRPGTVYRLAAPESTDFKLAPVVSTLPELEQQAMLERPELREEDYRKRIAVEEVHKTMLRTLPGLEIYFGPHYDSNSYLTNETWWDAGISISWNLFNVFSAESREDAANANLELTELRRMATAMAVLSQVHLAWQNHAISKKNYSIAKRESSVAEDILNQIKAANDSDSGNAFDLIRYKSDALVKRMQRDLAYADLANSRSRIDNSVGLSILSDDTVAGNDLQSLTDALRDAIRATKNEL